MRRGEARKGNGQVAGPASPHSLTGRSHGVCTQPNELIYEVPYPVLETECKIPRLKKCGYPNIFNIFIDMNGTNLKKREVNPSAKAWRPVSHLSLILFWPPAPSSVSGANESSTLTPPLSLSLPKKSEVQYGPTVDL